MMTRNLFRQKFTWETCSEKEKGGAWDRAHRSALFKRRHQNKQGDNRELPQPDPVASVQQSTDMKCEAKCSGRYKRKNDRRSKGVTLRKEWSWTSFSFKILPGGSQIWKGEIESAHRFWNFVWLLRFTLSHAMSVLGKVFSWWKRKKTHAQSHEKGRGF